MFDTCRMLGRSATSIFRLLAWTCLLAIVVLSLVPGSARPHTGAAGWMEHFMAYSGAGFCFALGYARLHQRLLVGIVLALGSAVLEVLQNFAPQRYPALHDSLAGIGGVTLGLFVGALVASLLGRD